MPVITLSAATVQAIRATPRAKPETFFDEVVTGFVLEARPRGGATYALRYKNQYGRQRQYKIANAADVTFAEAKKEAVRVKGLVALGIDPQEQRETNRRIRPSTSWRSATSTSPARTRSRTTSTSATSASTCCPSSAGCTSTSSARRKSWSG